MKNLFYSLCILIILNSCSGKSKTIYGYIPVGVVPQVQWVLNENSVDDFHLKQTIKVVSNHDTIIANIFNSKIIGGGYAVHYRNSYPPTKDKKIFVILQERRQQGNYYIVSSSIKEFKH